MGTNVVASILSNQQALGELRRRIRDSAWWNVFGDYFGRLLWLGAASIKLNT